MNSVSGSVSGYSPSTTSNSSIGQWGAIGKAVVTDLEKDGAQVLMAYIKIQMPALCAPIISIFTNLVVGIAVKFIITNLDNAVFAAYVAVKTNKQVSDYITAQDSGSVSGIDAAGDALIHLGG